MRQALRRTIGLGGAAFVAVGAALVLTLPASAHDTVATPGCADDGHATIEIHTTRDYDVDKKHPKNNSVTVTEGGATVFGPDAFGKTYEHTVILDGSVAHTVNVHVQSWDNVGTLDIPLTTTVCPGNKPTPTTTTAPPTTTTTVAPPTTTTAAPTTTTAGSTPTTTTAVVAAATTTSTTGTLPFTGVNAGFPLLIAGVLVVAGGGILLWLRLAAKRRRTES
jgi:hypothetical protein